MTRRRRCLVLALLVVAAGCSTAARFRTRPPAASPGTVEVVYELGGAEAAAWTKCLAERRLEPKIVNTGGDEDGDVAIESERADDWTAEAAARLTYSRLEIRELNGVLAARLAFYEDGPRRPAAAPGTSPMAAAWRLPGSRVLSAERPIVLYELVLVPAELPFILDELREDGAWGKQSRPEGGARIFVGPVGRGVLKDWTPEPRLNDLGERVIREGRSVSRGSGRGDF